jgi:hypothetical protein
MAICTHLASVFFEVDSSTSIEIEDDSIFVDGAVLRVALGSHLPGDEFDKAYVCYSETDPGLVDIQLSIEDKPDETVQVRLATTFTVVPPKPAKKRKREVCSHCEDNCPSAPCDRDEDGYCECCDADLCCKCGEKSKALNLMDVCGKCQ